MAHRAILMDPAASSNICFTLRTQYGVDYGYQHRPGDCLGSRPRAGLSATEVLVLNCIFWP